MEYFFVFQITIRSKRSRNDKIPTIVYKIEQVNIDFKTEIKKKRNSIEIIVQK